MSLEDSTKQVLKKIPLLKTNAGPRDPEWLDRLKEEYEALIAFINVSSCSSNGRWLSSPKAVAFRTIRRTTPIGFD